MVLEAAEKPLFVQQVKHCHDLFTADLRYSIHLRLGRLWVTYAGCQMVFTRQESVLSNCTLIVAMSVQCGYFTRSYH